MPRALDAARHLMDGQRYNLALPPLRAALREDPNSAEAHRLMGQCLYELRQPVEALAAARRAVALEPNDSGTLLTLAWLLHLTEQRIEARDVAVAAQARAPSDPGPLVLLADLAWRRGDGVHALALVDEALALAPEHPQALALRTSVLLVTNRTHEATRTGAAVLSLDPEDPDALHLQGVARMHARDLAGAERLLKGAVAAAPAKEDHRILLAYVRLMRLPVVGPLVWALAWVERWLERALTPALVVTGLCHSLAWEMGAEGGALGDGLRLSFYIAFASNVLMRVLFNWAVPLAQSLMRPRLVRPMEVAPTVLEGGCWAVALGAVGLWAHTGELRLLWAVPVGLAGLVRYVGRGRSEESLRASETRRVAHRALVVASAALFLGLLAAAPAAVAWGGAVLVVLAFFSQR